MSATSHRLQTHAWAKLRKYVLTRDGWVCQVPTDRGKCGRPASVCGHILPRELGGTEDPENLRAECHQHSRSEGGNMSAAIRKARDARAAKAIEILEREGRAEEIAAATTADFLSGRAQHPSAVSQSLSGKSGHNGNDVPITDTAVEEVPSTPGADDRRWIDGAPWLAELLPVPPDATWPRYMTLPHPRAVASLGPEFAAWAEARSGRPLRWWQRLVAFRLLEIDEDGRLVWEALILTMARQLGKSWLLRELCLWRIVNADRFEEPQLVLHTGKDLNICKEVQRSARRWARERPLEFKVREVNGQEEIAHLPSDSRWMIRARDAVYGYSASLAVVDEGWKVKAAVVDEGLEPTMTERAEPQILLVSTAHRRATSLMLARRSAALDGVDDPDLTLLIEWSAPRSESLEAITTWRAASPHWSDRRARMIGERLDRALNGSTEDPDEPDPLEAFRAQWLNQWPLASTRPVVTRDEPLFLGGVWASRLRLDAEPVGDLFLALEDWYGQGAAAAAVGATAEGPLVVGGWEFDAWADAIAWVKTWADFRDGCRVLVGASMANDPGLHDLACSVTPAGRAQTPAALSVLRELTRGGYVIHDGSEDLARQITEARVIPLPSGGLRLGSSRSDLLRCAAWAVQAAWADQNGAGIAIY